MRDYIDRHFRNPQEESALDRVYGHFRRLEKALAHYRESGAVELSMADVKHAAGSLSLRLRGWLDHRFFNRAARHLRLLLRHTRSSVTLHIDHFHETQAPDLQRLLRRLSRYGDRIRITVHERWRGAVDVDSSVFDLSFEI
jgi:hypothetical protein